MQNVFDINSMPLNEVSSFERALAYSLGKEKSRAAVERLLERFGSFSTVFSATEEEICRVGGISENAAILIKLIAYTNSRRITEKFEFGKEHSEIELREYIAALFLGLSVETVYALFLDDLGRVVSCEHVSEGTVNSSDVVPRKILEFARRRKSKNIILAHNHPKGSASPSKDDVMTTGRLVNLFSSIGVRLHAHYVVADGEIGIVEADMLYNPDNKGLN